MENFVPYEKMSKKAKKNLNNKKRRTWGELNPETKVSDKDYKKIKQKEIEKSLEDY